MFAIDPAQLDAMQKIGDCRFLERVVSVLETDFADRVSENEREEVARRHLDRGRTLGLSAPCDLENWVRLNAHFGAGFEALPWARAILRDTVLVPREKLHLLQRRAVFAGSKREAVPAEFIAA